MYKYGALCLVTVVVAVFLIQEYRAPIITRHFTVNDITVKELRAAHSVLKGYSQNIQGKFRVYRVEQLLPEALHKTPDEMQMNLSRSGTLWRSEARFRADYKSDKAGAEQVCSVAEDSGYYYYFQGSSADDHACLYRCIKGNNWSWSYDAMFSHLLKRDKTLNAPEYLIAESNINDIKHGLDSLWSMGGKPVLNMLDYPESSLIATSDEPLKGGYSIWLSVDGDEMQIRLDPTHYHANGQTSTGNAYFSIKQHTFCTEKDGVIFPARIIQLVEITPGRGYTEITEFDLEPLQDNSPVSDDFTIHSFRNMGQTYQVYDYRAYINKRDEVDIGARIAPETPRVKPRLLVPDP